MTRMDQIEALFHEARSIPPGEGRTLWLEDHCQGDTELLAEVSALLKANSEMASRATIAPAPGPAVPTAQFGAYRAVELLGRGGMSTVYRAERADGQFEQIVALKIMAAYLAGAEFARRFETERQLLATLSHNNITRLLDGGVSSAGDPYLITEYVEGEPLDRYSDERKLDVNARLAIFSQVLEAVDYAHRNLIVHRDLKPANILVSKEGIVKLLDFGTASLLAQPDNVTLTRVRMLTPRYASPEQLKGERLNIATDIYSLGVVLYELLCGGWPFGDPNSVLSELNRATGNVPPAPPATVLTEEAAVRRSVSYQNLRGLLNGDLSTILLKMLENEPSRRYGTVRQVADDLERYRDGRPILARPQTTWYRARKFVSRNWLAVSAATAAILALAGLTVFSLYQTAQAREQAARAQRVSEFAKNTFLSASSTWLSPLRGQSHAIQFNDILDNAAERVGRELANDPLAEADLRGTIGQTYSLLGDPAKGEAQIRRAIELLKQTPGGSPRIAAGLELRLCDVCSFQSHYGEALAACREAVALARVHGSDIGLGTIMHDTAFMAAKSGAPLEEVEALFREALANGPTDPAGARLFPALINARIGALRLRQGDLKEGERVLRDSEHILGAEPGPPIEIIPTLDALALGARIRGQYSEAIKWLQKGLDLLNQRPTSYMGKDDVEMELAADEALAGKPQALSRLKKIEPQLQASASSAGERIRFHMLTGIVEAHSGLQDSAERHFRTALATSEKELPRQPADRVEICVRLAQVLAASHREQEAADVAREGLRVAERVYGGFYGQHPFVIELQSTVRQASGLSP